MAYAHKLVQPKAKPRFRRIAFEPLEPRALLAFDLTISTSPTVGVTITDSSSTREFRASASGANLNVADLQTALTSVLNVVVNAGGAGAESGNISSAQAISLTTRSGTRLTIESGTGIGNIGDITLAGIALSHPTSHLSVLADRNISLRGTFNATPTGSINLSASGSIQMPAGGSLIADELTISARGAIGLAAAPILTSVNSLSADSASTSTSADQFFQEANGLTGVKLDAGDGNIALNVLQGPVTATFAMRSIASAALEIVLGDTTPQNVGSPGASLGQPLELSVSDLSVNTSAGGGSQFLKLFERLNSLNLQAGSGDITITSNFVVTIWDTDPEIDIQADVAAINLQSNFISGFVYSFGQPEHPVQTNVNELTVVNASPEGGSQYITESDGLARLKLAPSLSSITPKGTVGLTLLKGGVTDDDQDHDIVAAVASITLLDSTGQDLGTPTRSLNTAVSSLTTDTSAGGGDQYIQEANGLNALDVRAGIGAIALNIGAGDLFDSDNQLDVVAAHSRLHSGFTQVQVGTTGSPIQTNVDRLEVDTSPSAGFGGGTDHYLAEEDTATIEHLDAGGGRITLSKGLFTLASGDALGDRSTLVVTSPAVVNLASSDEIIGGLSGNGTVAFAADGLSHALIVTTLGTFSGTLVGNDVVGSGPPLDRFVKNGTGTLTLSGNNLFTGRYEVERGTLQVKGSIAASSATFVVMANGTLTGWGTINRTIDVETGGHLAPTSGFTPLTVLGVNFHAGSSFDVAITPDDVSRLRQLGTSGSIVIDTSGAGVALNILESGTASFLPDDEIMFVEYFRLVGTFAGLRQGAYVRTNFMESGLAARITYGSSHSIDRRIIALVMAPYHPWSNPVLRLDVNDDQRLTPADALAIINYLNTFGPGPVPQDASLGQPYGFIDTGGETDSNVPDDLISGADVLGIINWINAFGHDTTGPAGEGAPPTSDHRATPILPSEDVLALLANDLATRTAKRAKR